MTIKILQYLDEGNDFSNRGIQKNLGISEFMASNYKEQLERGGYIKKVENAICNSACAGCSSKCSSAMMSDNQIIMWEITQKGQNALNKSKGRG